MDSNEVAGPKTDDIPTVKITGLPPPKSNKHFCVFHCVSFSTLLLLQAPPILTPMHACHF